MQQQSFHTLTSPNLIETWEQSDDCVNIKSWSINEMVFAVINAICFKARVTCHAQLVLPTINNT